jgi:hypothetical protein
MEDAPRSYREFWPHYVRAHRQLTTQRVHLLASFVGAMFAFMAVLRGEAILVAVGIACGYAIAFASHRLVEGNWPTAARHPFWSAVADIQMCALLICGRMGDEMRRLEITRAEPPPQCRVQPAC